MEAAMNVTDRHSPDELHRLYRTTTDARLAQRIQAVWLARRGWTCPAIMKVAGASRRAVQQWIAKYNRGGIEELEDKPRTGRPVLLSTREQKQLAERIKAGPTEDDLVSVFSAPAVGALVEREFGILYSLRGIQRLLGRMGFSYLCPRPVHEKSDAKAQEAFKKTSRRGWQASRPSILASE